MPSGACCQVSHSRELAAQLTSTWGSESRYWRVAGGQPYLAKGVSRWRACSVRPPPSRREVGRKGKLGKKAALCRRNDMLLPVIAYSVCCRMHQCQIPFDRHLVAGASTVIDSAPRQYLDQTWSGNCLRYVVSNLHAHLRCFQVLAVVWESRSCPEAHI